MKQDNNLLAELIRKVEDPKKFPKQLYSGGVLLGFNSKNKADNPIVEYSGKFGTSLFIPKADTWYFVNIDTPIALEKWEARWKNAATGVEILYTFDLHIVCNNDKIAKALVESLHTTHKLEDKLKQIVEQEVDSFLTEKSNKLFDLFEASGMLSPEYNRYISGRISKKLGNNDEAKFGFRLQDALPSTVSIKKDTSFSIADSNEPRSITSSATFVPVDLSQIIASRLSEQQLAETYFSKQIEGVVTKHLATRPYYDLIQYFEAPFPEDNNDPKLSLLAAMKKNIEQIANQVGYHCDVYQSVTDLVVLPLVKGCRVDMKAENTGFKTKDSMGRVKIDIAVDVKINDFHLIQKFISPDEKDLSKITKEIITVCTDFLTNVSQIDFNLDFTKKVEEEIKNKIIAKLLSYGFESQVILCRPLPTEEAERLKALEGQSRHFEFKVSPQANGGDGVIVPYTGEFEVTGIHNKTENKDGVEVVIENGWYAFVRKSGDFSTDSIWSDDTQTDGQISIEGKEKLRKRQAIENELAAISSRIAGCLRETLAVASDLVLITRDRKDRRKVNEGITKKAQKIIADEFGLRIEIRQLNREDTISDIYKLESVKREYDTKLSVEDTDRNLLSNLTRGNSDAITQQLKGIDVRLGELRENLVYDPNDEDILGQIETLQTERKDIMEQNNVKGNANSNSGNFLEREKEQNNSKRIGSDHKDSSGTNDISDLFN